MTPLLIYAKDDANKLNVDGTALALPDRDRLSNRLHRHRRNLVVLQPNSAERGPENLVLPRKHPQRYLSQRRPEGLRASGPAPGLVCFYSTHVIKAWLVILAVSDGCLVG